LLTDGDGMGFDGRSAALRCRFVGLKTGVVYFEMVYGDAANGQTYVRRSNETDNSSARCDGAGHNSIQRMRRGL